MDNRAHGVFAMRGPGRPNPVGISTVRLTKIKKTSSTSGMWTLWTAHPFWISNPMCLNSTSAKHRSWDGWKITCTSFQKSGMTEGSPAKVLFIIYLRMCPINKEIRIAKGELFFQMRIRYCQEPDNSSAPGLFVFRFYFYHRFLS